MTLFLWIFEILQIFRFVIDLIHRQNFSWILIAFYIFILTFLWHYVSRKYIFPLLYLILIIKFGIFNTYFLLFINLDANTFESKIIKNFSGELFFINGTALTINITFHLITVKQYYAQIIFCLLKNAFQKDSKVFYSQKYLQSHELYSLNCHIFKN